MHLGRGIRSGQPSGLRSSVTTGGVWSDILMDSGGTRSVSMICPPGARTHWHSHNGGQFIYTVAGEGWIQERGGELVTLRPGDVVWTEPGVEHWHGGSKSCLVTQIMLHIGDVKWLKEVTDQEYGN